jgi:molybdopterin-guanine dinucleotide biosynthesis protein A
MHPPEETLALILAGGEGRRVANRDKGLLQWRGKALVSHVIDRLQPQVSEIILSCNRSKASYAKFGLELVHDQREGFHGPLAGLESAIGFNRSNYLIVVPCDTPLLPKDLVPRLLQPLLEDREESRGVSYAHDGTRDHYLCAAIRPGLLSSVGAQIDSGQRSVRAWYTQHQPVRVDFSDQPDAFRNINHMNQ